MRNCYFRSWGIILTLLLIITTGLTTWAQCSVNSPNGSLDYADCNGLGGWAFDGSNLNQPVTIDIYVDGVKTYSGITANGDRQDLVGAFGNAAARYHGFGYSFPANAAWKNGQSHSFSVRICGSTNQIGGSPKTVSSCTGGTPNPTPTGNCAYTEGQFLFTTSWGESMYAHYYNGALYAAYQDGGNFRPQHWLVATGQMSVSTASCFAENDPHSSTPPQNPNPTPTPPPTGNCGYTEGQYLFTFNTEVMYAHYYNGALYAAYQDGSNFRPQHWLVATGLMSVSTASCFAESDPHSSTPTQNPNPTPTPTTPAGNNFAGNLDGADCNGIGGWVANRNTPHQSTKFDVYINGWLVAVGVPATGSRQDVANALGISGYNFFGFYMPLPARYKTGSSMKISVKYTGTQTDIPGSPVTTAACPVEIGPFGCSNDGAGRIAQTESTTYSRTDGVSMKLSAGGSSPVSSLTSKLIPVRKGNKFSLDAYVYAPVRQKTNLTPQITTAVVSGVLAGVALTQQQASISDLSHRSVQPAPVLGVSTTLMIPLVKSLLAKRLPNASVEVAFYDQRGAFLHRQQVGITKTARLDWQLLHIDGYAQQDGYVAVRLQNRSKTPVWFDDISLQSVQLPHSLSVSSGLFIPKTTTSASGFAPQHPINTESLFRNCTKEDLPPVDGGWLDVDATVIGHGSTSGWDYGSWGWSSSSGSGNSTGTGPGGNTGGGGATSGATTFVPYNAPQNPERGQAYSSPTGATYIWDGKSWCILLKPVEVKGNRPTNPTDEQLYLYFDPEFGYSTVYEYISGRWTMPLRDFNENVALPDRIKKAKQSPNSDGCNTFKAMWERQNNVTHKEQAAFITDKGVFWLPDDKNLIDRSEIGDVSEYGGEKGKRWFVYNNVVYNIKAIIHTHPVGLEWHDAPSDVDKNIARIWGIPHYVISDNGVYKVDNTGFDTGVIDHYLSHLFDCNQDQNIVGELR